MVAILYSSSSFKVFVNYNGVSVAHQAGCALQRQSKALRGQVFVTNGFRFDWEPDIHTGYRSATVIPRRPGQSACTAIQAILRRP